MNDNTCIVLVVGIVCAFFFGMGYIMKSDDREQLRIQVEAGLIQKIEGGTVIWTKP